MYNANIISHNLQHVINIETQASNKHYIEERSIIFRERRYFDTFSRYSSVSLPISLSIPAYLTLMKIAEEKMKKTILATDRMINQIFGL